jgi:hypothetical protein
VKLVDNRPLSAYLEAPHETWCAAHCQTHAIQRFTADHLLTIFECTLRIPMLSCLPALAHCLTTTITGTSPSVVISLGSFGFHAHGFYSITIDTLPRSNLSLFLPSESEYLFILYASVPVSHFCFGPITFAAINHTNHLTSRRSSWSGLIPSDGVYSFVLINCANTSTDYVIGFDLRNPESFLIRALTLTLFAISCRHLPTRFWPFCGSSICVLIRHLRSI